MSVWLSCGFQSNDSSLSDVALADTTAARGTPTASSSSDGGPHVSFVRFHRCFLLRNTCTIRQHCVSNLTVSLVKKTFSLKNEKKPTKKNPKESNKKKKTFIWFKAANAPGFTIHNVNVLVILPHFPFIWSYPLCAVSLANPACSISCDECTGTFQCLVGHFRKI